MLAKVLLVEHDATVASELEIGLRANGCDVILLSDGETGLARAASDRFDVILLSGELPGMSGFRLCNRIKEDPSTRDVTTFLLSTSAADLEAHRRLPTHANAYFRRPVSIMDVIQQIRASVGEIKAEDMIDEPPQAPQANGNGNRDSRSPPKTKGGTLRTMDPQRVSNLDKARENARLFAEEVLRRVPVRRGAQAGCRTSRSTPAWAA